MRFNASDKLRRRGYSKLCLGAATTSWAYVPTFLTVEVSRALRDPRRDFEKGLLFSAALNVVVFVGVGIACVSQWGWALTDPIMATEGHAWPSRQPRSKALYFFWFVATAISYAFSSIALTAACQRRWLYASSKDDNNASQNNNGATAFSTWFLVSVPPFALALVMALVVPSLFAMLAVTTAATVPWVNHLYPAVLYRTFKKMRQQELGGHRQRLHRHCDTSSSLSDADDDAGRGGGTNPDTYASVVSSRDDDDDDDDDDDKRDFPAGAQPYLIDLFPPTVLVAFTFGVGVLVFVACAVGAAAKLGDHQLRGPVAIGCPGWQVYEDDLAAAA